MNNEEEILKNRNVKPTAVRLLVLRCLMEQENAVSLKDLEILLIHSDKSTLFRTLKTFEQQKVIHSIADGTGMSKYALCLKNCECAVEDQHFHFHCTKCESTFCLPKQSIPSIRLPPKFTIQQANLVLKGICANCN